MAPAALLDVPDLALPVDHESGPVGDAPLRDQHAVLRRHLALREIAQQRERELSFSDEFFLGRNVVGADAEYLGLHALEFGDTSLVRQHFLRSTTGEGGREECQHHGLSCRGNRRV